MAKKKGRKPLRNEESKDDGQSSEQWPEQFPYTVEQLVKAVVTPIKSKEAKKRLGMS